MYTDTSASDPGRERRSRYDAQVERALHRVLRQFSGLEPPITNHIFYGATEFDPAYLTIWFAFRDEAALQRAHEIGIPDCVRAAVESALVAEGFPAGKLRTNAVGFVSERAVDEAGGPWFYFH